MSSYDILNNTKRFLSPLFLKTVLQTMVKLLTFLALEQKTFSQEIQKVFKKSKPKMPTP
jgi:hypothetical protein